MRTRNKHKILKRHDNTQRQPAQSSLWHRPKSQINEDNSSCHLSLSLPHGLVVCISSWQRVIFDFHFQLIRLIFVFETRIRAYFSISRNHMAYGIKHFGC